MAYYQIILRKKGDVTAKRVVFVEAPSEATAREVNASTGWDVTSVSLLTDKPKGRIKRARTKILKGEPLVLLCRGLASMVGAGITLQEALKFYAGGLEDKELSRWLTDVRSKMLGGVSAAPAFAASGHFDDVFVGLVAAGSESASIEQALNAIADRTEMVSKFKTEFLTATGMPTAVLLIAICTFVYGMCNTVPEIRKLVESFHAEPDGFSKFVFNVSSITQAVWPVVFAVALSLLVTLIVMRPLREAILLFCMSRWRLLRNMIMGLRQLLILSSMAMLTRNGVQVRDALGTTADIAKGSVMESELRIAQGHYVRGMVLSMALEKYTSFDRAVIHLVLIGEIASTLPEQFERLTVMYSNMTSQAMKIFTRSASILAMVAALAMIGFVFAGTMLPVILLGPRIMRSAH
jgi:type II secretory pathway component PulF